MRLLFAIAAVLASWSPVPAQSLCKPDETTWFNAKAVSTESRISICGGPKTASDVRWLQFRFGTSGTTNLAWPKGRAGSSQAIKVYRYTESETLFLMSPVRIDGVDHSILESHNYDSDKPRDVLYRAIRRSSWNVLSDIPMKSSKNLAELARLKGLLPRE